MSAARAGTGGTYGHRPPRRQVPKYSYRVTGMGRAAGSASTRPLREGQPGPREVPGAGHGPRERKVLSAHSLTRLGYSFSTQPPHIPTPFTKTVLQRFREDETSREQKKGCRMRPKYSTLEYLLSGTYAKSPPVSQGCSGSAWSPRQRRRARSGTWET